MGRRPDGNAHVDVAINMHNMFKIIRMYTTATFPVSTKAAFKSLLCLPTSSS